jgi:starch-binding outer membrane protein, SusD/RagB family
MYIMKTLRYIVAFGIIVLLAPSCMKDLDTVPLDKDLPVAGNLFDNPANFKAALAKLYAGYVVSGQRGPAGDADIQGIDEGFSTYLRQYWYHQELTTEEAVIAWSDGTIKDFHWQVWTSTNEFVYALYSRLFLEISYCNEFVRNGKAQANPSAEIKAFIAEARFLRALAYYHALDLFGNVPFVDENDKPGKFFPKQILRADLFAYIEKELLSIEPDLIDARANEYGRADKAAVWTLLSKLYLNAEVYLGAGNAKYTECITYSKKVIDAGYSLNKKYRANFCADNQTNAGSGNAGERNPEIIFPFVFDNLHTQTWGGMVFVIHAAVGGSMSIDSFGITSGWGGTRITKTFFNKFTKAGILDSADSRAMFHTDGQTLDIVDISQFTNGYAVKKFSNRKYNDDPPTGGPVGGGVDTDWPFFRLADVYLMYAEAVLRGGSGGDAATALGYVNAIKERAYGNTSGNITSADLTLDFILDERARELYWEGHRRTDLIRFGRFSSGSYIWEWKGKVAEGVETDSKLNLFPVPSADIIANSNLKQNPGY